MNNEKKFIKLTPFKMQVLQTFPFIDADFDAITNYELLCKVVDYLNKTIDNVDVLNVKVEEYINKFNELKKYVDNYFTNLDVQEEINNKLDQMAKNGQLTNLIENYVNPFIEEQNSKINNLDEQVNKIDIKVNKTTSGSPLVASSTSDMTDTNRIYVNTTDGYWYYYNGTTWVQGGVYQASEDSTTLTDVSNTLNNIVLKYHGDNFLNENTMSTGQLQSDGTILTGGAYDQYRTSDFIPVGLNTNFTLLCYAVGNPNTYISRAKRWLLYDENKTIIANSFGTDDAIKTIIDTTNAKYFKYCYIAISSTNAVSMVLQGNQQMYYKPYTEYYVSTTQIIDNNQYKSIDEFKNSVISKNITHNKNLHNPATDEVNKFLEGYNIVSLNNYTTTDYIPINYNQNVIISPYCRDYVLYDNLKRPYYGLNNSNTSPITITPRENGYIRISYLSSMQNLQVEYDQQTSFINPEFKTTIEENVYLSDTLKNEVQNIVNNNILTNKKLVACGDSFTQYTNAQFENGIYQGQNKVWPFLIGLRNNMNVVNMAVSGSTMAINSYSNTNFANTLYTQIPSDADYIIIKYGINDLNGSTPIGTIDSTDDTTFYGAWNKVMQYIIANHPTAKIGIIVTNGLYMDINQPNNSYYANAIIEIAKKYGIPTLNEWNDPNVPLLLRTGRNDVDESIRNIRLETFRVAPDNTHENYICQEYESTFIEEFLRRL